MIRIIDAEGIDGIITCGRPAGLWMAESAQVPMKWIGIHADGQTVERKYGAFGDVLTWLQIREGVLPCSGECPVRMIEDPIPRVSGKTAVPLRVEGAEIREWRGTASPIVERQADGWGTNTIKPVQPETKPKRKSNNPSGRPIGSTGTHQRVHERDGQILRLVKAGLRDYEIAQRLDCSPSAVGKRIKALRESGRLTNQDVPIWRLESWARAQKMWITRRRHEEEGMFGVRGIRIDSEGKIIGEAES